MAEQRSINLFLAVASACLLVSLVAPVNGQVQASGPTVALPCGQTVTGVNHGDHVSYLGIPYAEPPVSRLRFQPAQLVTCPSSHLNATSYGPACHQQLPTLDRPQSEDCLNLDVHVPSAPMTSQDETRPTLVWVYGGSNVEGSTSMYIGMPKLAAAADACVFSMNYRLGPLGYLAVDALALDDARGVAGNYGLTDIIASLQWVQANGAAFGCSTTNVTIYGQSSGGTNILALLANDEVAGLFSAAYALSPSTRLDFTQAHIQERQTPYLASTVCQGLEKQHLANCLRYAADAKDLVKAMPSTWNMDLKSLAPGATRENNNDFVPLVYVDGVTMKTSLKNALQQAWVDVPLVISYTSDETLLQPIDEVFSWTSADLEHFFKTNFSHMGPDVGQKLIGLYSPLTNPLKTYYDFAADVGMVCGVQQVMSWAHAGFQSPSGLIEYAMPLSQPLHLSFNEPGLAYPFHIWDWIVMEAAWNFFGLTYTPSAAELAAHEVLLNMVSVLAHTGRFTLAEFGDDGTINVIDNTTTPVVTATPAYKQQLCNSLTSLGFDDTFWWIN
ncbi:uncharacterized protein MONBRDRAFT_30920 [Monosiga brevicollis MX1]|uniref:Carboxylesterase type B domain-containing protein n=1 Tax=Monosiga brevicollis TaxID=81824 RepID=A9UQ70_MONBE|nr:uncharacterized protein MONBRDRAFT_30920 [Monosiga brevicollis MX1]EDQ92545.1 predicted protein [Monosiga brevicollis MX1]|eukprot:XP_001742307.1 hypothetical protein [Monosiga brevicollis MX1]